MDLTSSQKERARLYYFQFCLTARVIKSGARVYSQIFIIFLQARATAHRSSLRRALIHSFLIFISSGARLARVVRLSGARSGARLRARAP